jgi:hypothetical protein
MQIEIEDSNRFGPLDPARLEAFEARLPAPLPEPYRRFLLSHNGGYPSGARKACILHHVCGIHDGPDWAQFRDNAKLYGGVIPKQMLPFADDPGGNFYCISLHGPNRGAVYFFDHESSGACDGFTLDAPDFDAFLQAVAWRILASRGDIAAIETEIREGFNIHQKIYGDRTLFDLALEHHHLHLQKLLHQAGARPSRLALLDGVASRNLENVRFLVEIGSPIDAANEEWGTTPLMLAATFNELKIAQFLLASGANRSLQNKKGETAAQRAQSPEMKKLLS